VGWDAVEQKEQQGEIRHCWEAKLGILSAYSTGDVLEGTSPRLAHSRQQRWRTAGARGAL